MWERTVALFGEAEHGEYKTAYFCRSLEELAEQFGQPPEDSIGLHYAVQALLFDYQLIFFRVAEEGYAYADYLEGLHLLENQTLIPNLSAIALPGVGEPAIIDASAPLCHIYHSILITTEADLYDYLTSKNIAF
jgi:hypothetical protein